MEPDTGAVRSFENNHGYCKPLPKQLSGFSGWLNSHTDFADSSDGQKVAATTFDNDLFVWPSGLSLAQAIASKKVLNVRNKRTSDQPRNDQSHEDAFLSVKFSPCNNYVFVGSADGAMHQLDATTGEAVYAFAHDKAVTAIETSPDGNTIYAGLQDGTIAVWQGELLPPQDASLPMPISSDAPDGPQSATMIDDALVPVNNIAYQEKVRDFLCLQNFSHCYKHGKRCCSLCSDLCKVSAACCRTGTLCVTQCPRMCVKGCCCRVCVKKICAPFCGRIARAIRGLWQ